MHSYVNSISEYLSNYQRAIENINIILGKLDAIYYSLIGAGGEDINRIRGDIENTKNELINLLNAIVNAKNKTIARAESCDRCLRKYSSANYLNEKYPSGEVNGKIYGMGATTYVGNDGLIHVSREYGKKHGFIESLFMASAGEYYEDIVISMEEMFNS